jgi:hypothetical protein
MKSVDWLWPNNKRIAVVFNVCLEQWSDGGRRASAHGQSAAGGCSTPWRSSSERRPEDRHLPL